ERTGIAVRHDERRAPERETSGRGRARDHWNATRHGVEELDGYAPRNAARYDGDVGRDVRARSIPLVRERCEGDGHAAPVRRAAKLGSVTLGRYEPMQP